MEVLAIWIIIYHLYKEKTVYIKTHKTAINRAVDHTGDVTHILIKVSCFLLKSFHFRR